VERNSCDNQNQQACLPPTHAHGSRDNRQQQPNINFDALTFHHKTPRLFLIPSDIGLCIEKQAHQFLRTATNRNYSLQFFAILFDY
jgi:hypothetical protein